MAREADRGLIHPFLFRETVARALEEDLGRGDLTTDATVPRGVRAEGRLIAKEGGVLAGAGVAAEAFRLVDGGLELELLLDDGARLARGDEVLKVRGEARSILMAERVALNFVQRLSGIATATARAVEAARGTKAKIVDTRKTTPGLRVLEKYAVRVGGGRNHRFGLDDAVMIKENHIAAAGGIGAAVRSARAKIGHMHKIEVEVERLDQVDEALEAGADVILLDNMDPETMRRAVEKVAGRALVEASGGIRPEDVGKVAQAGVDVISLGWLTHSAPALDLSLELSVLARP